MSLITYQAKRNFSKTAEPKGSAKASKGSKGKSSRQAKTDSNSTKVLFVIQKHAASRLHYDFRLEMEGVLKSWAVPKGIPTRKGEKHLAVEVEDHPVEYANFEGIIPAGNYGGGTVMLWDAGLAEIANPHEALRKGKLELSLQGKKLSGQWALIRMHPKSDGRSSDQKPPWLLIKTGTDMRSLSAKEDDRSVQSRRSMKQIAEAAENTWESNRKETKSKTSTKSRSSPRSR